MADFQANLSAFEERGVALLAASVDAEVDARELIDTLGLTFPIGYGLNYLEFASKTGAFYEVRRQIIHATDFILWQDGTIAHAVYATGPVGRLWAEDCIRVTG